MMVFFLSSLISSLVKIRLSEMITPAVPEKRKALSGHVLYPGSEIYCICHRAGEFSDLKVGLITALTLVLAKGNSVTTEFIYTLLTMC